MTVVPAPMTDAALPGPARAAVLAWFDASGRALRFRGSRDPYAILVSEVMAQQTQIARVEVAWFRFIARFPTVGALAAAGPADVLRQWRGMGYDRRALNLRRAAGVIMAEHGGEVPRDVAALERLPGIGPYTARAVAAIAFGTPVGAVDTNVRRVLGRVLAGSPDGLAGARLQAAADAAVDPARPADWTHAVMDIGATVCRPRRPACGRCPLAAWCRAAERGVFGDALPATAPASGPARPRRSGSSPFSTTTRWLRGRIVDRLRDADGDGWARLPAPIGAHDQPAIRRALLALERDGLVELDAVDPERARLATS